MYWTKNFNLSKKEKHFHKVLITTEDNTVLYMQDHVRQNGVNIAYKKFKININQIS